MGTLVNILISVGILIGILLLCVCALAFILYVLNRPSKEEDKYVNRKHYKNKRK